MIKWSTYGLLFILGLGLLESVLLGYSYFIIFAALLFFTVAADVISFHLITIPRLNSLSIRRKITSSRSVGSFEVEMEFRSAASGLVYFSYVDRISDGLECRGDSSGTVAIRGRHSVSRSYTITTGFFGRHSLGPTQLNASDAFGLCFHIIDVGGSDSVSIPPVIAEAAGRRGEPARKSISVVGANTLPRAGQGYQFLTIRPYTIYDDSRRIAWNRFGSFDGDDVYVKEMEDERTTDTMFVIDFSTATNIGQIDRIYCSEISSAIRASLTICKQGDRVGYYLHSSTRDIFVRPMSVEASAMQLQKLVTTSEPDGVFTLSGAITGLRRHYQRSSLTILISPLMSTGLSMDERGVLSTLSGRSVRLIVPGAWSYFERSSKNARQALTRLISAGSKDECINRVRSMTAVGVKAKLSTSKTLLGDLSSLWLEGRYSYAGF